MKTRADKETKRQEEDGKRKFCVELKSAFTDSITNCNSAATTATTPSTEATQQATAAAKQ